MIGRIDVFLVRLKPASTASRPSASQSIEPPPPLLALGGAIGVAFA
jgi:hypothetical protein